MKDEEFVKNLINGNISHIKKAEHPEEWIRQLLYSAISYGRHTISSKKIEY